MTFLGLSGFYHYFIKDFSKIGKPLTNLLDKDVSFRFSEGCHATFITLTDVTPRAGKKPIST